MARFETPCQIVSLFLCAALVSVAVIFVLQAEAHKRYGGGEEASASSREVRGVDPDKELAIIEEGKEVS